jgi:hypothetical protein
VNSDDHERRFDPFGDRTARDIRNALSAAFAAAWNDQTDDLLPLVERLRNEHPAAVHRRYIDRRAAAYREALAARRRVPSAGLLDDMMVIWNRGLFFEVHELLEDRWHDARGERREVLKTLIQAAAAFVHREAGRTAAGASLGRRASTRLDALRPHLTAIANLDQLREALAAPGGRPPQLKGPDC